MAAGTPVIRIKQRKEESMRKHLFTVTVAALALTLALPLRADDAPPPSRMSPVMTHGNQHCCIGVLNNIAGNKVTIQSDKSAPLTLTCRSAKFITPAKNTGATMADLKVGDTVKAYYSIHELFGPLVSEITVLPPPKPAGVGTKAGQGKTGKPK